MWNHWIIPFIYCSSYPHACLILNRGLNTAQSMSVTFVSLLDTPTFNWLCSPSAHSLAKEDLKGKKLQAPPAFPSLYVIFCLIWESNTGEKGCDMGPCWFTFFRMSLPSCFGNRLWPKGKRGLAGLSAGLPTQLLTSCLGLAVGLPKSHTAGPTVLLVRQHNSTCKQGAKERGTCATHPCSTQARAVDSVVSKYVNSKINLWGVSRQQQQGSLDYDLIQSLIWDPRQWKSTE